VDVKISINLNNINEKSSTGMLNSATLSVSTSSLLVHFRFQWSRRVSFTLWWYFYYCL